MKVMVAEGSRSDLLSRVIRTGAGVPKYDHSPYLEMIDKLIDGAEAFELTPEKGETVRKLKIYVARAGTEKGVKTVRVENDGKLYVWLKNESDSDSEEDDDEISALDDDE